MEQIFKPKVVLALIEQAGKFILIRRRVPSLKVEWAFPGGVTIEGETEEESVAREAKQEVGLDVNVKDKLLERKHPNTFVQISYFYCLPKDPKQVPQTGEPEEIAEICWVEASEVLKRFTSDAHPVIRDFVMSKAKK